MHYRAKYINDRRRRALHRIIAQMIRSDPSLLDPVRVSVEEACKVALQTGRDRGWEFEWKELLKLPINELCRCITSPSERMTRLRLSSPLPYPELSEQERRRLHRICGRGVPPHRS